MHNLELKLMCGIPRSGKSSWIENNKEDSIIVSTGQLPLA
jgi:predicted kinase